MFQNTANNLAKWENKQKAPKFKYGYTFQYMQI